MDLMPVIQSVLSISKTYALMSWLKFRWADIEQHLVTNDRKSNVWNERQRWS